MTIPGPAWPRMRFCDAPALGAATRLDLNERGLAMDPSRLLAEGFSLGMAQLSGEPGGRGRVWGERTLPLPLVVHGTKPQALARLQAVARELTRAENWLEWQLSGDTAPRWFHTYAAAPSPLSLDRVYVDRDGGDSWTTTLSAPADPFAVGEPVVLDPVTVRNHPSAGANPMWVELPAIEGEAAAPAVVRVAKAAAGGMLGPAVAVVDRAPVTVQPASWGAGVGGPVADPEFVAGSYRPTTGALTDWTAVATFAPSTLTEGRWRTLLRVSGSSATGSLLLRWRLSAAGVASRVHSTPRLVQVAAQVRWVDAGEVPWPLVNSRLTVTSQAVLTLETKRVVAGGDVRFDDRLLLLPGDRDATLLRLMPDYAGTGAAVALADAETRETAMTVAGAPLRAPATAGGWPHLSPHRANILWVAQALDPTEVGGVDDDHGSETIVSVSYRPRYLWGV